MRSAPHVPFPTSTLSLGERSSPQSVLLVSGPLPPSFNAAEDWQSAATLGNVTAVLRPLQADATAAWIGWPALSSPESAAAFPQRAPGPRPVTLSAADVTEALEGFSETVIGPLFHGYPRECRFASASWRGYRRLNRKVARAVVRAVGRSADSSQLVWVHDPLLINVAAELRQLGVQNPAALFFHLPFPGPDLFLQLPWRTRVLSGLLAYRQVGFQSPRDLVNFIDCVRDMVPGVELTTTADGLVRLEGNFGAGRFTVQAGVFPVGIDAATVHDLAAGSAVEAGCAALRARFKDQRIVLGLDPLRLAQGVLEKLDSYAELLAHRSELIGTVCLIQVVVPDRSLGAERLRLRQEIERRVGEINGAFSRLDWQPIQYRYQALPATEILSLYRAADTVLLTPLREGMNLVAKEFCAAQVEDGGALVLSEFAGSAPELATGAMLVNPHAVGSTARALVRALRLSPQERAVRMRRMRTAVRQRDVRWWATSFLDACENAEAVGPRADLRSGGPAPGLRR
jgi:trehalose-6-phosphate synthase